MLSIEDLTVAYGRTIAVDDLTLDADDREVLGVIGPSGCGKSTLLRAVAGLVPPEAGSIRLDGTPIDGLRPDQRGVGLMFQDHALFPHRTVADNVAFGPRMRGLPRSAIAERVAASLDLVDLAGAEHRRVTELSGGEQQRVALARAVAPRPRLLMLDEPLGSLDRALRDRLLADLPRVFERTGTTVVYVTHDQDEALALCDRIAVVRAGRLEQLGTPDQLWRAPDSEFVARFLGLEHILHARVTHGIAVTELGRLPVSTGGDGAATLVLRADALRVLPATDDAESHELTLEATVVARRFAGDHVRVQVTVASGSTLTIPVWRGPELRVGDAALVALDPAAVHRLPEDGSSDLATHGRAR